MKNLQNVKCVSHVRNNYEKNQAPCCDSLVFLWNTVNFVGFSVIHVSQGSVATYVMRGEMSIHSAYSKFPAESVGERIFKIG